MEYHSTLLRSPDDGLYVPFEAASVVSNVPDSTHQHREPAGEYLNAEYPVLAYPYSHATPIANNFYVPPWSVASAPSPGDAIAVGRAAAPMRRAMSVGTLPGVHGPVMAEPPTWPNISQPFDRVPHDPTQSSSIATTVPEGPNLQASINGAFSPVLESARPQPRARPSLRCKWEGCGSPHEFRSAGDLVRHLRSIHIAPRAFVCPRDGCGRSFGRNDHLREHIRRRHR
ncbi:hypothetical protein BJY00DRAFT_313963 [Aspergillus carlsbadensis]|nr:hypothetical protein BJY00DRAFT_313963 [Aspergillus carlsbadensis]